MGFFNYTVAKKIGYEIVRRSKHPTLKSHIKNIINHYKINLILDVGAHQGEFGKLLHREGYKGEIHSFEPVSQSFNKLSEASHSDPNWFVYKNAIGDVREQKKISISSASNLSSFLNLNDFGKDAFNERMTKEEIVEVDTIDNFLNSHIKNINQKRIFLKMDTQGYDLNVFKGALKNIKHIICMLSELAIIPCYSEMPHYLDVLREYEKYGFIVSGMYPIGICEDMSLVEMDCMLVNHQNINKFES